MLPTFTPSYDSSWGDSVPSFGKPRPTIPIRREPRPMYIDKRPARVNEEKVEGKLTLRTLPTWMISKFAAYPWVGDKQINQDSGRAPVIP